jgi:hypothetical protein
MTFGKHFSQRASRVPLLGRRAREAAKQCHTRSGNLSIRRIAAASLGERVEYEPEA